MPNIIEQRFNEFARQAKNGMFGRRTYALSLAHAVQQAICCDYKKITAIELGVASGAGLKDLCCVADHLQKAFEVEIEVIGFDTGEGLPKIEDYRDHPEIWRQGDFSMAYQIPDFPTRAQLFLGNVKETIPEFVKNFSGIVGFVSLDLDLYSSTVSAMPLFEMDPVKYLPAMPVYVDDMNVSITYNPWCGEALALTEFNQFHALRKFEEKPANWDIQNFHVFHVLDHPIRNGVETPLHPLNIEPFYSA